MQRYLPQANKDILRPVAPAFFVHNLITFSFKIPDSIIYPVLEGDNICIDASWAAQLAAVAHQSNLNGDIFYAVGEISCQRTAGVTSTETSIPIAGAELPLVNGQQLTISMAFKWLFLREIYGLPHLAGCFCSLLLPSKALKPFKWCWLYHMI